MRISDLRCKQVINVCDGKALGYVSDVDFDINKGIICAIIVPGPFKWFSLAFKEWDYVIPYECITCIGPDAILAKVRAEDIKVKCP